MGIIDKMMGEYEARSATRQSEETMDILKRDYPQLMELLGAQDKTAALNDLNTARAVTPGYNDLAMGELSRLAPQMTGIQKVLDAGQAASDVGPPFRIAPNDAFAAVDLDLGRNSLRFDGRSRLTNRSVVERGRRIRWACARSGSAHRTKR